MSKKADKRIVSLLSFASLLPRAQCSSLRHIPSAAGKASSRFTLTTEFGNTFFVAVVAS